MQISRRTVPGSTTADAQSTTACPPNIVFPISNDHTAAGLGCCGNTHVQRIGNSNLKTALVISAYPAVVKFHPALLPLQQRLNGNKSLLFDISKFWSRVTHASCTLTSIRHRQA